VIIDTFHANYVIPKDRGDPSAVQKRLDHIAASLLKKEVEPLLPQMGLPEEPLVFIKHIALDLVFDLGNTNDRKNDRDIARLWAREIIRVIKKSLPRIPSFYTLPNMKDNIIIFPNRAIYMAHFLRDLLVVGDQWSVWYYREFKDLHSFSPREIVKLLCRQNREFLEAMLLALRKINGLPKILEILTEDDTRFIYNLLPGVSSSETAMAIDTTGSPYHAMLRFIEEILVKGDAVFVSPFAEGNPYKLCLILYLEYLSLGNKNPVPGIDVQYPGTVSKAWVKKAIETIVIENPEAVRKRDSMKGKTDRGVKKIKTAYGGLFLLIPAILKSRLTDNITQSSLPGSVIPALNGFLYVMVLNLARQNAEYPALVERDDPGFYAFAGLNPAVDIPSAYLGECEESLNLAAIIQWLATDEHRQTRTPTASAPSGPSVASVISVANKKKQDIDLQSVLVAVNEWLLRLFAKRLAGFENSSPSYLFTHFIRRSSEITIKDDKIEVNLSSKPLDTVLRLSGLLEETPHVPWWDNKTLVLQLQGERK